MADLKSCGAVKFWGMATMVAQIANTVLELSLEMTSDFI